MKMRAILLIFISIKSLTQPMQSVKKNKDSDIPLINQITSWLKSGRDITIDKLSQVGRFLSHEEYKKCLVDRKNCSKKKFLALVALDFAIFVVLLTLHLEKLERWKWRKDEKRLLEKRRKAWLPRIEEEEEQIIGAEREAPSLYESQEERFKLIKRDRTNLRKELGIPYDDPHPEYKRMFWMDTRKVKDFFRYVAHEGELNVIKELINWVKDETGSVPRPSQPRRVLGVPGEQSKDFHRQLLQRLKTEQMDGYSAIGVAAASHKLNEDKKREVINFLKKEMGIMPTEKDREMVRLAEWEKDQPAREAFQEFIGNTRALHERGELSRKELPAEMGVKIWKEVVSEPLLPRSSKKQEED